MQAIAILANGLNYKPTTTPSQTLRNYFDDAAEIPDYAKNAVTAATENFIVVNYPKVRRLHPNQNATRAEIAALLCQALQIENVTPPQYVVGSEPLVIQPQFDNVEAFSEGVAWVKIGKKWGVIDKTGKRLIEPEYYEHYAFSDGVALTAIGDKYGFIDKTGKFIELSFNAPLTEPIAAFSEGLARVSWGSDGFIDKTGKIAIVGGFH